MSTSYRPIVACIVGVIGLTLSGIASAQSPGKSKPVAPRDSKKVILTAAQRKKIEIDLDQIGADGLRGPMDGKVSVSYEFCIPDTERCRAEVRRLDPTVHFMPGASGHIGAKKGQCLCIGTTQPPHWRTTLYRLAALPYVPRIIEAMFE